MNTLTPKKMDEEDDEVMRELPPPRGEEVRMDDDDSDLKLQRGDSTPTRPVHRPMLAPTSIPGEEDDSRDILKSSESETKYRGATTMPINPADIIGHNLDPLFMDKRSAIETSLTPPPSSLPQQGLYRYPEPDRAEDRYDALKKYMWRKSPVELPHGRPRFLEQHSNITYPDPIENPDQIVELILKISDFLHDGGVDFEFIEPQSYFKCSHVHSNYYQLDFRVYLYLIDDQKKSKVLVEFQRRSGDVVQFMELFSEARSLLRDGQKPDRTTPKEAQWGSEIPTVGTGDVLQCLEQMIDSDYTDVRFEAMRAIAFLSSNPVNKEPMIAQGMGPILIKMLHEDESESIRRCAATTVANIAVGQTKFSQQIYDDGGVNSLCQLVQTFSTDEEEVPTRSIDDEEGRASARRTEVIREAARALSALTLNLGHTISLDKSDNDKRVFLDVIDKGIFRYPDKQAQDYGRILWQAAQAQPQTMT